MNSQQTTIPPVAIIGIGCLFPKAEDLQTYWVNIVKGVDAITEVPSTHWNPDDYFNSDKQAPDKTYARRGGFLDPVSFAPLEFGVTPRSLEATDTTQLLGLLVAKKTLDHAGYGIDKQYDRDRVSVVLGVTGTLPLVIPLGARLGHPLWRKALAAEGISNDLIDRVIEKISEGYVGWQEDSFPGLLGNVVAGRIANRFDLGGTNCVVDAACASSLSALHLSLLELASGQSDMVLSGGMDTFNDIFMYMCFSKTPALSPSGDARPFDANADGTTLGEGLGCLLLKRLEDAERDADTIYAVIRSIGTSSDGKGQAVYAPSPAGQAKALRSAYKMANVSPTTVELVEAHGTGTKAGDTTELKALLEVYRSNQRQSSWCALGSVKSQIGHTKAAAGAAGIIKATLALHHKVLPPTAKLTEPVPELADKTSPLYANVVRRPWLPSPEHPRRAAVSSFGFGGSNFHCVLEEYTPQKSTIAWDPTIEIGAFSGQSLRDLSHQIDSVTDAQTWDEVALAVRSSRANYNSSHEHRLTLVLTKEHSTDQLQELREMREHGNFLASNACHYAIGPRPGKLALLFPGQGSQYVGMLGDLVCAFPQAFQEFLNAQQVFLENGSPSETLADCVFPKHLFTPEERRHAEQQLRRTNYAQPALGAVSFGAFQVLRFFGVLPDMTAGHSFGELTALASAGRLRPNDFHRLGVLRGNLMAELGNTNGSMLAVEMSTAELKDVLRQSGSRLTMANNNAPAQCVLSGSHDELDRVQRVLVERGVNVHPLSVGAAFHSPAVAQVAEPFHREASQVVFQNSPIPVYANTTAKQYPPNSRDSQRLIGHQLAEPVEFQRLVENVYADGARTFLEVGPSRILSGLVRKILHDRSHQAISLDNSKMAGQGVFDLAQVLAKLAALGHNVDLNLWNSDHRSDSAPVKKSGFIVPLSGANYVAPRTTCKATPAGEQRCLASDLEPTRSPEQSPDDEMVERTTEESHPKTTESQSLGQPDTMEHPQNWQHADRSPDEGLRALQEITEQTARLHKQFLDSQERALALFEKLFTSEVPVPSVNGQSPSPDVNGHPPASMNTRLPESTRMRQDVPDRNGHHTHSSTPPDDILPTQEPEPNPSPWEVPQENRIESINNRSLDIKRDDRSGDLLQIVSEKTGYPAEMLNIDMELDADLGIDSIKRVEIFSAVQERFPELPPVRPEQIGTLRTLRDVLGILEGEVSTESTSTPFDSEPMRDVLLETETNSPQQPSVTAIPPEYQAKLLEVVSEKTGYPADMLDLTMEIDADLGIDSIKRVEILSALQERLPGGRVVESDNIGSFRTLQDVLNFLTEKPATWVSANEHPLTQPPAPTQPESNSGNQRVQTLLLDTVAEKTGYPASMLEMSMEIDADLGIDSIKRVEIFSALQEALPDAPVVQPDQLGALRTLQDIENFLANGTRVDHQPLSIQLEKQRSPRSEIPPVPPLLRLVPTLAPASTQRTPIKVPPEATIWVIGDEATLTRNVVARLRQLGHEVTELSIGNAHTTPVPDTFGGLILIASKLEERDYLLILATLQRAGEQLKRSAANQDVFLATVTQIDGEFGFAGKSIHSPITGGLAGLTKTLAYEWPGLHCKAMDVAPHLDLEEAALAIVDEVFLLGPTEVAISASGSHTVALEKVMQEPVSSIPLNEQDVVLVSGGGRGITAECVVQLVKATGCRVALVGRSPEPKPEPNWLNSLESEQAIKRALIANANGHTTPRQINDEYGRIIASRELRNTLTRLKDHRAQVTYQQVDVRDQQDLKRALSNIESELGRVTGLVHGAGVLADKRIEHKTSEQFSKVYQTKVTGFQNLLATLSDHPLKVIAAFSSSTARFGRTGQLDYAVANEVLNKMCQQEAVRRPDCRVVAFNWGPWDSGMVTPELRTIFEAEGIQPINTFEGASFFVHELANSAPTEIVVLGEHSAVPSFRETSLPPRPNNQSSRPTPGAVVSPNQSSADGTHRTPATVSSQELLETMSLSVSVEEYPVLRDHVIGGKAVVPVALQLEWLAQGALHANPGLVFLGCDDLQVYHGIKLATSESVSLAIATSSLVKQSDGYRLTARIVGQHSNGKRIIHAQAQLCLASRSPDTPPRTTLTVSTKPTLTPHLVYETILFHGEQLRTIQEVVGLDERGIVVTLVGSPKPHSWIRQPLRSQWVTAPLALDGAFQAMIVWCSEFLSAPSLPTRLGRYRQFVRVFPKEDIQVFVSVTSRGQSLATADIEWVDVRGALLARLEGYECVVEPSLFDHFRQNQLPGTPVTL